MKGIFKSYLIVTIAVYATHLFIPALLIPQDIPQLLTQTFILALFFWLLLPVLSVILFPLTMLTFGLFAWMIHLVVLFAWIWVSPVAVVGWDFPGLKTDFVSIAPGFLPSWQSAIIAGLSIILIRHILSWLID